MFKSHWSWILAFYGQQTVIGKSDLSWKNSPDGNSKLCHTQGNFALSNLTSSLTPSCKMSSTVKLWADEVRELPDFLLLPYLSQGLCEYIG